MTELNDIKHSNIVRNKRSCRELNNFLNFMETFRNESLFCLRNSKKLYSSYKFSIYLNDRKAFGSKIS
jgi:hypothetical protein